MAGSRVALCRRVRARGRARGNRAGPGPSPRRGRRVPPGHDEIRPMEPTDDATPPAPPLDLADVAGRNAAAARSSWRRPRPQPAARRAARDGKTMLGRRLPRSCRPSPRRGARGHADPLGRRAARARQAARHAAAVPMPHQRASVPAIVGGGTVPRPGEASLAHRGVLFLDELPEFPRPALEALRQPLEDGVVSVARVGGRARLPGPLPARRHDEPVPLWRARRPRGGVRLLAAQRWRVPGQASRALLDRFDLVVPCLAAAGGRARRPPESSEPVRRVSAGARTARRRPPADRAHGERAARPRGRAASALRSRRARVARGDRTLAGWPTRRRRPEHVAEALSYRSPRAVRGVIRRLPRCELPAAPRGDLRPAQRLCASAARSRCSNCSPSGVVGARARARRTAPRSRRCWRELAAAGWSSSAAWPAESTVRRTGAPRGGRVTVAVLGCGIDRDYPAAHAHCRA